MSLTELFCAVDDFYQGHEPCWRELQLASGKQRRVRRGQLYPSEIMTLLIHFHQSHYRDFKAYYTQYVQVHLKGEFPGLVSYQRFVELMPGVLTPLCVYLQQQYGQRTGLSFIDSTALAVCHNRRIHSHRVFKGLAARGKTSVDWFYGFKLHVVVNDRGQLLGVCLTPGNVDDRRPVPKLTCRLFGDRGYLSQPLVEQLLAHQGLHLITKLRKSMKTA